MVAGYNQCVAVLMESPKGKALARAADCFRLRLPQTIMRSTFLTYFTLSLVGAFASADQVPLSSSLSDGWSWSNCGKLLAVHSLSSCLILQHLGLPTDIITIKSLDVKPDPPVPGEDLTVTAIGVASEVVEVRYPSRFVGLKRVLTYF